MSRYLILGALALGLTSFASAQETRSDLNAYNNANIKANGRQEITGPIVNNMNGQFITSMGVLGDTNAWTGTNTFSGPFSFAPTSMPNVQRGDAIPPTGQPFINSSGFVVFAQ